MMIEKIIIIISIIQIIGSIDSRIIRNIIIMIIKNIKHIKKKSMTHQDMSINSNNIRQQKKIQVIIYIYQILMQSRQKIHCLKNLQSLEK